MQKQTSGITAGLLGITLGSFGVHYLYLKEKKNLAYIHSAVAALALLLLIIAATIDMNTASSVAAQVYKQKNAVMTTFYILGYILLAGNTAWGTVEGFLLLTQSLGGFGARPRAVVKASNEANPLYFWRDPSLATANSSNAQSAPKTHAAAPRARAAQTTPTASTTSTASAPTNPASSSPVTTAPTSAHTSTPTSTSAATSTSIPASAPTPTYTTPAASTSKPSGVNASATVSAVTAGSSGAAAPSSTSTPPTPSTSPNTPPTSSVTSATPPASVNSATTTPSTSSTPTPRIPQPTSQPLSEQSKKKIMMGSIIACASLAVIVLVVGIFIAIFHVDYRATYLSARTVRDHVVALHNDKSCENVIDYVDSTRTSEKTYADYITGCKEALVGEHELVARLGSSSGVKKVDNIGRLYNTFQSSYAAAFPNPIELAAQLDLYSAWHAFVVRSDSNNLTPSHSVEKDYRNAAAPLIDSGNRELREFGEDWLDKALAYRSAYKAYWDDSSASTDRYSDLSAARDELNELRTKGKPNLDEVAKLDFSGINKMYENFRTLYRTITRAYEDHYDNSNLCSVTSAAVTCD